MVYFELLKPGETVNADRYRQQIINLNHALIEKWPESARRHGKVILQHDNAPSHTAEVVKNPLKALNWEFWNGILDLLERWEKCVESNGQYFK